MTEAHISNAPQRILIDVSPGHPANGRSRGTFVAARHRSLLISAASWPRPPRGRPMSSHCAQQRRVPGSGQKSGRTDGLRSGSVPLPPHRARRPDDGSWWSSAAKTDRPATKIEWKDPLKTRGRHHCPVRMRARSYAIISLFAPVYGDVATVRGHPGDRFKLVRTF